MYIMGCHGLLKVSGTTPFVYQLLMTLLVMMLQLVLVMRPQLAMMLATTGDSCRAMGAWYWQCSWDPCGLLVVVVSTCRPGGGSVGSCRCVGQGTSVFYDLHSVHLKTVCPVGAGRTGLTTQC